MNLPIINPTTRQQREFQATQFSMADDMAEYAEELRAIEAVEAHFPPVRYSAVEAEKPCRVYRLPLGCDYQGRHPQAAEPCTEIGADGYVPANSAEREHRVMAGFVVVLLCVVALASLAYRVWVAA